MSRPESLEQWDSRYPEIDKVYASQQGRGKKAHVLSDVRSFVHGDDVVMRNLISRVVLPDDPEALKVVKIHAFVCHNLRYKSDDTEYGNSEHWAHPDLVSARGVGDCEDGSFLLASMLINAGIDPRRVRVNAGWVMTEKGKRGGHAWVTYLRSSDNNWVILDWCYWAKPFNTIDQYPHQNQQADKYLEIWFSWNNLHCWDMSGQTLVDFGRVKKVKPPEVTETRPTPPIASRAVTPETEITKRA